MSTNTANVYVVNNSTGNATITLSHVFATDNPEEGYWTAAPGQQVGPLQVTFYTYNPGLDFWWISLQVLDGPQKGLYQSEGTAAYPGKECLMESEDAGQNLIFTVDTGTFNINLASGGCSTSMSGTPDPVTGPIQNVFVLMLENRSFDHMLGFSGITGTDAETGEPTSIIGLAGTESNSYLNLPYTVQNGADLVMPADPGHEFPDAVQQLCGPGVQYTSGAAYPAVNNSGFVYDYATTNSPYEGATSNFGEIMKCYSPSQLPVLNLLAQEYAVCDKWFSSLPGPTWPNRFFAHAASSGGLDHSPTNGEMIAWESYDGYRFPNGTIFDAISNVPGMSYRLYRGVESPVVGSVPIVAALHNISLDDTNMYENFATDVAQASYPYNYTFIEPNYGDTSNNTYSGGMSQHPMDNVMNGEQLIWDTYSAIRNSPHWQSSVLIITYDEHGGFYDHITPPSATPPGDTTPGSTYNQYGFTFGQYGVRVPAIVISPFVPANTIDHRQYDHSSIPATLEALFGLPSLTARDAGAKNLTPLFSAAEARTDCVSEPPPAVALAFAAKKLADAAAPPPAQNAPGSDDPLPPSGNLLGFLHIALKTQLQNTPPPLQAAVLANFQTIQTRGQAKAYIESVMNAHNAKQAAAGS